MDDALTPFFLNCSPLMFSITHYVLVQTCDIHYETTVTSLHYCCYELCHSFHKVKLGRSTFCVKAADWCNAWPPH